MGKKKGSGKKKGKGKAKKLTDEEKAELAKEEEKQKELRTELATTFLKEKLEQEERNTRISLRKLNEHWRTILRKAKSEDLQQNISILHQTFERMLDRKDATIKALVKDLAEAEKQETMSVQSHITMIEKLVASHEKVMSKRRMTFNSEIDKIRDEFVAERSVILSRHKRDINNIKDIMFAMKMQYEDISQQEAAEFSGKRDEMKTKNMEAIDQLKQDLEKIITDLWDLFQQALDNYKQGTKEKQEEFDILRAKDKEDGATIERQMRKLNKMLDTMNTLKQEYGSKAVEFEEKNRALRQEKEGVLKQFQLLKEQMNRLRATARTQLTQLTVDSKKCKTELQKRLEKANGILKQTEICRKLETEQEKVLPFYEDTVTQNEINEAAKELGEVTIEEQQEDEAEKAETARAKLPNTNKKLESHEYLALFWKRYNKVMLEKLAMEKERQDLDNENQRLRSILKQYLDGISVSDRVLQQDNTLMVVNGRTNAPINAHIPVGDGRVQMAIQQKQEPVMTGAVASNAIRS
eukprot:m.3045 g.3045  ORF g.3045 m.3045 type:complete len:523 (-) comp2649_c0_seq1:278-1846(-)